MIFTLNNLCYAYGPGAGYALRDVSLTLDSSKVTGLAGANGSGKTTLIRILLGQLIDIEGEYAIDQAPVRDTHGEIMFRHNIGYAPDEVLLDDYLTGREIMEMVAALRKIPRPDFESDIELFTENLRLENWFQTQPCKACSSGMRRKIELCLAYLGKRAYVVLDEPTNGLDPLSVYGLKKIVQAKKAAGTGALIASHILDFVDKTANDCVLLCAGKASYAGSLELLKKEHPAATLEEIYFTLFNR
jgi:ABC-type multidrug transport system ATPase subunit